VYSDPQSLWITHPGSRRPSTAAVEGVDDEFGAVVVGHRVADEFARGQVQPGGEVEPVLGGGEVGDVPDDLRAGSVKSWPIRSSDGTAKALALVSGFGFGVDPGDLAAQGGDLAVGAADVRARRMAAGVVGRHADGVTPAAAVWVA
jgi:hypothetical protein